MDRTSVKGLVLTTGVMRKTSSKGKLLFYNKIVDKLKEMLLRLERDILVRLWLVYYYILLVLDKMTLMLVLVRTRKTENQNRNQTPKKLSEL